MFFLITQRRYPLYSLVIKILVVSGCILSEALSRFNILGGV
jgi:hypothetical protein